MQMDPMLFFHRPRIVQQLMVRFGGLQAPERIRRVIRKTLGAQACPDELAIIHSVERVRTATLTKSKPICDGTVAGICRQASMDPLWCRLMFYLVREFRPTYCIEMGTCMGISGSYIATALRMNGNGKLATIEKSPDRVAVARENFKALNLGNVESFCGTFNDHLPVVLSRQAPELVFVDGHHDGDATVEYFGRIRSHLAPENVLVFDDIRWSSDMYRAWRSIRTGLEAVDLGLIGICLNVKPQDG